MSIENRYRKKDAKRFLVVVTPVKVNKSRKQILVSLILPKNERNSIRLLSWVCFVRFLEE